MLERIFLKSHFSSHFFFNPIVTIFKINTHSFLWVFIEIQTNESHVYNYCSVWIISVGCEKKEAGSSLSAPSFLHTLCLWSRQSAAAACDKTAPLSWDLINGHTLHLHHTHTHTTIKDTWVIFWKEQRHSIFVSLSLSVSVQSSSIHLNSTHAYRNESHSHRNNKTEFK